jgi:tRNA A37 threonylcarbamoyladenosine dehydratase
MMYHSTNFDFIRYPDCYFEHGNCMIYSLSGNTLVSMLEIGVDRMLHQFSRNELAIGKEGLDILKNSTVAVLGIGGVGSFAAEALARSGVEKLILIDKDDVDITNVNRQVIALLSTVGRPKVELMKERIADINPECEVIALKIFYTEETYEEIFGYNLDFVIDASDTISYKIHLMKECLQRKIPIISSMGAANKMDPTRFQIADISKTHTDPIAKVVRTRLRKEGIKKGIPVVFSDESPIVIREDIRKEVGKEDAVIRKAQLPPSSNAFVPSVAGLIMASYVVRQLLSDIKINTVRDAKDA